MRRLLILLVFGNNFLGAPGRDPDSAQQLPVVSHVYWITLHAREVSVYDSLHRLFIEELQIPYLFDTETYGSRRYFAIHAGNVILEPCGPFEFHESFGPDVKTRFNTLAFRPLKSALASAERLKGQGFDITVRDKDELLNLTVDEISTEFLPVNISKSEEVNQRDKAIIDSLGAALIRREGGPLGLEYMEEIHLGYNAEKYLEKWQEFLHPLEHQEHLWYLSRKPNIRFIRSERAEIVALVFKVNSLEQAAQFLQVRGLLGECTDHRLEMDIRWGKGIRIILTE